MLSPEQEKQVEEIRERHKAFFCGDEETGFNQFTRSMDAMSDLLAIVDDLRKQLNAAVLLGQAAASLNKPMTDEEFRNRVKCNPAAHVFHAVPKTGFPYTDYVGECIYCGHVPTAIKKELSADGHEIKPLYGSD